MLGDINIMVCSLNRLFYAYVNRGQTMWTNGWTSTAHLTSLLAGPVLKTMVGIIKLDFVSMTIGYHKGLIEGVWDFY